MGVKLGNGKWAIKEDKLLAYNDNSGRFFNKEFDFSRGSSATYVAKDGLIKTATDDTPRIDFSDTVKGALLLEPQSTNLVTYSEDFSNAVWNTWQVTKTELNNLNPKGINGYYEISHTGSSTNNPNTRLINVSLNGSYTLSVFVKTNQSRYISLSIEDYDGDRAKVYFDTVNKTFTTIANVGSPVTNTSYSEFSNEWIRITLSVNLSSAFYNEIGVGIYNPSGSFLPASGEVISIFGAQLEALSYATSYIPTAGSTVTRLADVCNNSGSAQDFNSEEGVLYAEIAALADDSTNRKIAIGSSTNRIIFGYRSGSNNVRVEIISLGSVVFDNSQTINNITTFNKFAIKYKQNDFSLWINSQKVSIDTSGNTPIGLNELAFDDGSTNPFYGKVRELQVFTEALTDEQLEKLTS